MNVLRMCSVLVCALFAVSPAFASVNTDQLVDGAVTTPKIADGAVTDAKIAGPIASSKINGLDAALAGKSDVTHNHDSLYQQKYGKVAVVALTGGDYQDPVSAMNDIATWCGTPSAQNPCLVKIMPGVYDMGSNSLYMASYVDVEGSGVNVTKIRGTGTPTGYASYYGTIFGASNSELRSLTAENNSSYFVASVAVIYNNGSAFKVTDVVINPFSRAATSIGILNAGGSDTTVLSNVTINNGYGVYGAIPLNNDNSRIKMDRVTISKTGYQQGPAIENIGASEMTITNSTISVSSGGYNHGFWNHGSLKFSNSSLTVSGPDSQGIYVQNGGTAHVNNSEINVAGGLATYNGGGSYYLTNSKVDGTFYGAGVKCIGVYNGSYDPVACQ